MTLFSGWMISTQKKIQVDQNANDFIFWVDDIHPEKNSSRSKCH